MLRNLVINWLLASAIFCSLLATAAPVDSAASHVFVALAVITWLETFILNELWD